MKTSRRSEPQYLYLTTIGRRSGRRREIEIWFTRLDGRYHLIAERRERAHWIRNLVADPTVSVRVGKTTFRARARVVDARIERRLARAVRELSERKYGWGDGLVVELTPHAAPAAMKSALEGRSHAAPFSGHPRTPPASRTPLQ